VKARQVPWEIDQRPRAYNEFAAANRGRKRRKPCKFLRSSQNRVPRNLSVTRSWLPISLKFLNTGPDRRGRAERAASRLICRPQKRGFFARALRANQLPALLTYIAWGLGTRSSGMV
jgi:hypothetical protein